MRKLSFSPNFEVMFDYRGITRMISGTSPHNPEQARVVFQNASIGRVPAAIDMSYAAAADMGQATLEDSIRENYEPVAGRAVAEHFDFFDRKPAGVPASSMSRP
jgi:hypothetical protein